MATYTKFQKFPLALASAKHNLVTAQLTVALTNSAPSAANDDELADISEVSYANVSTRNITTTSCTQTGGTLSLILADLTLTASGAVGPFQYIVIYNDSATNKDLICFYNYGSAVTMAAADTFLCDFDPAGLFTLA